MTLSYPRQGCKTLHPISDKNTDKTANTRQRCRQAVQVMKRKISGVILTAILIVLAGGNALAQETDLRGPVTGFPLPRYVSIQASEAYARRGPSRSHRIDWVFQRRNMPMQVVAEHGHWRRVIDRDGAGGWMHYSLLSGIRTAIVEVDMLELHQRPDAASPVTAQTELGVIAFLLACNGTWCRLNVAGHRGWVPQDTLWGVDPEEVFD